MEKKPFSDEIKMAAKNLADKMEQSGCSMLILAGSKTAHLESLVGERDVLLFHIYRFLTNNPEYTDDFANTVEAARLRQQLDSLPSDSEIDKLFNN